MELWTSPKQSGFRWALGFDGECCTCSGLARRIVELADHKLIIVSLASREARHWRKQALGPDAPWLPTLFAINGDLVQAWTGPAMALRLARLLGPSRSWQVVRLLGELRVPQNPSATVDPSRRRAVKALGGAAIAVGIALGKPGVLPSAATSPIESADGDRWEFEEPDVATRRLMETAWGGEESRAYRHWLDERGYEPEANRPRFVVARRNGEVAYKNVASEWRHNGRAIVILLTIGNNGRTAWNGFIHEEGEPALLGRLKLSSTMQVDEEPVEPEVAAEALGCPSWLWCPSGCDICSGACSVFLGGGGALGIKECLIGCYSKFGPVAGTACSGVCSLLVAYGALYVENVGCGWFCDNVAGAC